VAADGGLVFANYVEFDTLWGHRRDVPRYSAALDAFDRRIPELVAKLKEGDLLLIVADHGNDPTWTGTDHTREHVPIVGMLAGRPGKGIGRRNTLADIGETIAAHLGIAPGPHGTSFL
jgi:phosphopentomutase